MFLPLIFLTAALILVSMAWTYYRNRDPLHPIVLMGPMFLYMYAYSPGTKYHAGLFEPFIADESKLIFVQLVNLASIAAFCIGITWERITPTDVLLIRNPRRLSEEAKRRIVLFACVLGFIALTAYVWLTFVNAGGLLEAYSRRKGGGKSVTGYLNEAPLLAIPAIVLLFMASQGERRPRHLGLILLFASPHLVQGILGARRGQTFIIFSALMASWYLISSRRPKLITVLLGIFLLGCLILFLFTQRSALYIGSETEIDMTRFTNRFVAEEVDNSDEFLVASGVILTSNEYNWHYWGRRFAVTYFVRPIPKQIWPTKYEDCGVGWLVTAHALLGMDEEMWMETVGYIPNIGAAAGFIADSFIEFSWGCVVVAFLIGRFYSFVWKKAVVQQGIWTLIYLQAAMLSIYVTSQSVSAVFHRFLFMTIPTVIIWVLAVAPWIEPRRWGPGMPQLPRFGRASLLGGSASQLKYR